MIGRTAQLSMHPVLPPGAPSPQQLPDEAGIPLRLGPAAITGDDVDGASAVFGSNRTALTDRAVGLEVTAGPLAPSVS